MLVIGVLSLVFVVSGFERQSDEYKIYLRFHSKAFHELAQFMVIIPEKVLCFELKLRIENPTLQKTHQQRKMPCSAEMNLENRAKFPR